MSPHIFWSVVIGCLFAMVAPPASEASEFGRVFGVQVFLEGRPTCAADHTFVQLDVRISSFESSLSLDVIVGEIARQARLRGADSVYDIEVTSFAAGDGGQASAKIGVCAGRPTDTLLPLISKATSAAFGRTEIGTAPGEKLGDLNLTDPRSVPFSETRLMRILVSDVIAESEPIVSSCPFRSGMTAKLSGDVDIWVVSSTECDQILVGSAQQFVSDAQIYALTHFQTELLKELFRQ